MAIVESTIAASGADYTTISAWEAATDLNGGADIWKGVITDSSEYDENIVFNVDGANDSTSYVWLTVDASNRHSGVWDTGKARLAYSGTFSSAIDIQADYTLIEHLQIYRPGSGVGNNDNGVEITAASTGVLLSRLIIWTDDDGVNTGTDGIMLNNNDIDVCIDHCVVYGWARSGFYSNVNTGSANHTVHIDHSSFIFCGAVGSQNAPLLMRQSNGLSTFHLYNSIFRGFYNDRDGVPSIGRIAGATIELIVNGSHNAYDGINGTPTDNTTATISCSAGVVSTDTPDAIIVTDDDFNPVTANTDLTPQNLANNVVLLAGTNRQGSEPDPRQDFSVDIAGNARPATTPDVGAFEVSNAGGGATALAASLSGTSDATGTGTRRAGLAASLVADSDVAGSAGRTASLQAAPVGTSDFAAAGAASSPAEQLAAVLGATSDTTATGSRTANVAGSATGTSDLAGTGARTAGLAAAVSGTSTFTADGDRTAALSTALTSTSGFESTGGAAAQLQSALTGTSTVTATGSRTAAVQTSLSGTSDASGVGSSSTPLVAALTGASDVVAAGTRRASLAADLPVTSDASGVGTAAGVTSVSASLAGISSVEASGARTAASAATLTGTSDVAATGAAEGAPEPLAASLVGTSAFDVSEFAVRNLSAAIAAISAVQATGRRAAGLQISLTGTSDMPTGDGQTVSLAASLTGRSILVEGRGSVAYKKERATGGGGSTAVAPLFPNGGVGLDAYAQYLQEVKALGGLFNTVGLTGGGTDSPPLPSTEPARTCGPVFACMTTRMHVFSEITFAFQERHDNGGEGKLYRDGRLKLLDEPWPGATTGDLLAAMEMDVTTAGNSFWVLNEDGRQMVRLDPRYTSLIIEPIKAFAGSGDIGLEKTAIVVEYPDSKPVVYPINEVAHYMPIPDPAAPWRGMSWISPLLGSEGDVDSFIQTHKKSSLQNRAAPALAVVFPPLASQDVVAAYRDEFERLHGGGPSNRGKTIFTGGGADIKTVGMTWDDLDLRAVQGHGETRIAACAGVPPIIVGLSEGLLAATYSNYGQARRRFADGTLRHLWRAATGALEKLVPAPRQRDRLWYSDRHVDFVQEDVKDEADIRKSHAQTIRQLIDIGFEPDAAVEAVSSGDLASLEGQHTGLFSVQLQPPMTSEQIEEGVEDDEPDDDEDDEEESEEDED